MHILPEYFGRIKKIKILILFFSILFLILFIFNIQSYFEFKKNIRQLAYANWDEVLSYLNGANQVNICNESECYGAYVEIQSGYVSSLYVVETGEQFMFTPTKINPDGMVSIVISDTINFQFKLESKIIDQAIEDWREINNSYRE